MSDNTLRAALEFMLDRFDREGNIFSERLAVTKARAALAATAQSTPEPEAAPAQSTEPVAEVRQRRDSESTWIQRYVDLPAGSLLYAHPDPRIATLTAQLAEVTEQRDALASLVNEARRAIGDHYPPNDCYATGPLTGNDHRDLVECPACSFITMHAAIAATKGE